jgi:RNA polymerase sigma-70 factor (ECF subfamily)
VITAVAARVEAQRGQSNAVARDDDALAHRAARGDTKALEALLERSVDRVHALCRRVLLDPDDALDATQDALLAVTRGISRFDGRSAFSTWLYRVATNAALDELRRRRRRPVPIDDLPEPPLNAPPLAETVAARIDIDAALAALIPDYRVAVVLRDLCDLDYSAIAEILDVPPGTVRSRIARGRAAFATALGTQTQRAKEPSVDD